MELSEIRSFLAVAEAGSLSRAALSSGIPQATLSRHLARLEASVGGPLFYRDGRGVRLTEIGGTFQHHVAPLLVQLDRAHALVAAEVEAISGTLRLGVVPAVAQSIGAQIVIAFGAANPGVELELLEASSRTLAQWLDTAFIDVAILYDTRQAPTLSLEPVLEEELRLVCRSSSPEAQERGPISLAALDPERMILPSSRAQAFRLAIEAAHGAAGGQMRMAWRIDSIEVTKRMVEAEGYLTILPEGAVAKEVAEGKFITRPIAADPPPTAVMVVGTATSQPISRAARRLVKLIPKVIEAALDDKVLIGKASKGAQRRS